MRVQRSAVADFAAWKRSVVMPAGQIVTASSTGTPTAPTVAPAPVAPVQTANEPSCPVVPCPTLPSSESAFAFVRGDPGSTILLLRDLTVRSVLIAAGMYAVGERDHLWRNAIAGGIAIECFVLLYINATMGHSVPPITT